MNNIQSTPEEQEKYLSNLQEDINKRYAGKPQEHRERVFQSFQIVDLAYDSLDMIIEAFRQGGEIRTTKNGKKETVIVVTKRTEYEDFERHRDSMIKMAEIFKSLRGFVKTFKKDDRTMLENKLAKITVMLQSLRNFRYVLEGIEDAPIIPLILSGKHAAFAKRVGLSQDELHLFRKYGSTRVERVLKLFEDRFSDFSIIENLEPNKNPDRPFFIKQEPPHLEEDLLCVFADMTKAFPHLLGFRIEHIRPISIGNTRGLREFLKTAQPLEPLLARTFDMAYANEFVMHFEEYRRLGHAFIDRKALFDVVALGLGFSPGITSLLTIEPSWIGRLIAPVQTTDQVLIMYYLLGILLGYDEKEIIAKQHVIVKRLLEFPERKGVHYLGIAKNTLGVLVQ